MCACVPKSRYFRRCVFAVSDAAFAVNVQSCVCMRAQREISVRGEAHGCVRVCMTVLACAKRYCDLCRGYVPGMMQDLSMHEYVGLARTVYTYRI